MRFKTFFYNIDTDKLFDLIISNDWQLIENQDTFRLHFSEQKYWIPSIKLLTYNKINESKGWETSEWEAWTIKKIDKSIFLILTHFNLNPQIYQIKNFSESKIETLTCWNNALENINLTTLKKLSQTDYIKKSNNIIGTWKLIDFKEPTDSLKILGMEEEIIPILNNDSSRIRPFMEKDSVPLILFDYYKTKDIYYEFLENGICLLKTKDQILRKSKWKLSDDGKYIKTTGDYFNQIQIISLTDSILTIKKYETIEFIDKPTWEDKYFKEKLKRITVHNSASCAMPCFHLFVTKTLVCMFQLSKLLLS